MNKELERLVKEDEIAVEMARRKVVFHNNEKWDTINLWGLFKFEEIEDYLYNGKLINHLKYEPKNRTYWVIPSEEYWKNSIEPIVEKFSEEELQESF